MNSGGEYGYKYHVFSICTGKSTDCIRENILPNRPHTLIVKGLINYQENVIFPISAGALLKTCHYYGI